MLDALHHLAPFRVPLGMDVGHQRGTVRVPQDAVLVRDLGALPSEGDEHNGVLQPFAHVKCGHGDTGGIRGHRTGVGVLGGRVIHARDLATEPVEEASRAPTPGALLRVAGIDHGDQVVGLGLATGGGQHPGEAAVTLQEPVEAPAEALGRPGVNVLEDLGSQHGPVFTLGGDLLLEDAGLPADQRIQGQGACSALAAGIDQRLEPALDPARGRSGEDTAVIAADRGNLEHLQGAGNGGRLPVGSTQDGEVPGLDGLALDLQAGVEKCRDASGAGHSGERLQGTISNGCPAVHQGLVLAGIAAFSQPAKLERVFCEGVRILPLGHPDPFPVFIARLDGLVALQVREGRSRPVPTVVSEERVDRPQQRGVRTEISVESIDDAPLRHPITGLPIDAQVGAAETVDGLLGIAHGDEPMATGMVVDEDLTEDGPLGRVGVLELVHQGDLEAAADGVAQEALPVSLLLQGAGKVAHHGLERLEP